jgi:hypothetical protein
LGETFKKLYMTRFVRDVLGGMLALIIAHKANPQQRGTGSLPRFSPALKIG